MNIPRIGEINSKKVLLVDDKPFYMIAGEIHNSNSSSKKLVEETLRKVATFNLNTVLVPVTWQIIEPEEGKFDFDIVDHIIRVAKELNLKIGVLWFGSWKNAQCSYCPSWIKSNPEVYKRAELVKGKKAFKRKSGILKLETTTISPFSEATMLKDGNAFKMLLKHIKENDPDKVIISVQVENETGFLGSDFDYSKESLEKYNENVPQELIAYLKENQEVLEKNLAAEVKKNKTGKWEEVFGKCAHEVFIAYYTAKYVNYVAGEGKKEYPLPMVVNCWLNTKKAKPGKYPCGGPVAKMMEVWKCAAPNIDVFCPDNYLTEFLDVCDDFTCKHNNPLYIPESGLSSLLVSRELYGIGHYNAMCFSPFGIEDIEDPRSTKFSRYAWLIGFAVDSKKRDPQDVALYAKVNDILNSAMGEIMKHYGTADLLCLTKERDKNVTEVTFDDVVIKNRFLPFGIKDNATLICRTAKDEFLLIPYGSMISFKSINKDKPNIQNLSIEEGRYNNGVWETYKVINGDEEMMLPFGPALLKVKVNNY